jgi:hypothetical protein
LTSLIDGHYDHQQSSSRHGDRRNASFSCRWRLRTACLLSSGWAKVVSLLRPHTPAAVLRGLNDLSWAVDAGKRWN